jgi:hypothetical protein
VHYQAVDAPPPPEHRELVREANGRLGAVLELTEQAIATRPAQMLEMVDRLRAAGPSIALDDVGAVSRSLALMPLIAPDVVKLDMRLVQDGPDAKLAAVANAVSAEAERTGAAIIAEGIETPGHVAIALALGADYGQGWLYGRPGPLPEDLPVPAQALGSRRVTPINDPRTPFEIVAAARETRQGQKSLLLTISRQLERQAALQGESTILIAAFQEARHFTRETSESYRALASGLAFVAAIGNGIPAAPSPGIRGGDLAPESALVREWNVTVVAPHFAAAFVGRDLGDTGEDAQRRFDFAITYDRELAIQAARALMREIAPLG